MITVRAKEELIEQVKAANAGLATDFNKPDLAPAAGVPQHTADKLTKVPENIDESGKGLEKSLNALAGKDDGENHEPMHPDNWLPPELKGMFESHSANANVNTRDYGAPIAV